MPLRALGSRPMIRLRGRLRSTMIGPVSVVSANPRWPTESTASTRIWNRAGTVCGTAQMYRPVFSCPSAIGCHEAPGWSGRQKRETDLGARCRSVARQVMAILPEFTPVPTCTGSSCTAGAVASTSTQLWGGSPGAGG